MKLNRALLALPFACLLFGIGLFGGVAHAQLAPLKMTYTLTPANRATCSTTGCFIPVPAGLGFQGFHILIVGTAQANCQVERQVDGSTWAIETVTAGGSTTQMENWSFTGTAVAESEDLSEATSNVSYRVNCPTFTSGSLGVVFVQGN